MDIITANQISTWLHSSLTGFDYNILEEKIKNETG
jgi:hypothetical protein